MRRYVPLILDCWTMARHSAKRLWCLALHRYMIKLASVTSHYLIWQCRICGTEHLTQVAPYEARPKDDRLLAWPMSMAARWYRHGRKVHRSSGEA
jgi:hypothetical protein